MTVLPGYAEMMDKLKKPDNWDITGIIADVSQKLIDETDNGAALAVIDTLLFRMRDIANLISHNHAKRIDPTTIREAAEIVDLFCVPKQEVES